MANGAGIRFMVDMAGLAASIGAVEAAEEYASTDEYMDGLITHAHNMVSEEFTLYVVSIATATGSLNHMFEWGTQGINKGRTTRRMNPLNPEAQLWRQHLAGTGKTKELTYRFMPSKVPVPLPTTSRTGIPQRYIAQLKGKHVFWNKAAVMELGEPVTIKPKPGRKLFIPHGNNPPESARPIDLTRGFTMTNKPVTFTPGTSTAGNFTAVWERFWDGTGADRMEAEMEKGFMADMDRVMAESSAVRGRMAPPSAEVFNGEVTTARTKGAAAMRRSTAARKAKK